MSSEQSQPTTIGQSSPVTLHWFLPTYGDSRSVTAGGHGAGFHTGTREADLGYLTQLALAAEANGFESVLTPTGLWCADAWLVTASLIATTTKLKFLVALRPGLSSPLLLAQQAETFQRLSHGRLLLNVVIGGEDEEQLAYGDHLSKNDRYRRAGEVLTITDHLWNNQEPITFEGEFAQAQNARLAQRPEVSPPIYLGGSSQGAVDVSSKHVDVYLTWGEAPEPAQEKIQKISQAALEQGRELEYGIRFHIIARPTSKEAWEEAGRLLDGIAPSDVERIQQGLARSQSESQRRMSDLHDSGGKYHQGQDPRDLQIYPGLWAGVGLVRGGAGTALVGSYEEVAALIAKYRAAGFRHFILSGYPHLEETYHVGEGVVPALQALGIPVDNHEEQQALSSEHVPFLPTTR